MEREKISKYFEDVELEGKHDGYIYKVTDIITILILGGLCGLQNVKQIHQWAASDKVSGFLKEKFAIVRVSCYFWMLTLLGMIKPASLSHCFTQWVESLLPKNYMNASNEQSQEGKSTLSLDGKTIRSTGKMKNYKRPLHIISAQFAELGITYGQRAVDGKSNEIPAVQELLKELDIRGCMVTADALNCQRETAQTIINGGADYLLCAKDNQEKTREAVENYISNESNSEKIAQTTTHETSHGRDETRTAYVVNDVSWFPNDKWPELHSVGAIHRTFKTDVKTTDEWHYYICSCQLTPEELLHHARMEWSVETMHWLLDVRYCEDACRIHNSNIQQNMNILRKLCINVTKIYKRDTHSKRPISNIMFDNLLDCNMLERLLYEN